jgi:uncharacterized protein
MVIGTLEFTVLIRQAHSLKEKRQAIKSLKDRILHRFPVSIAEVGALENHQRAEMGVAIVSNDSSHAISVLSKVVDLVRGAVVVELLDYHIDTV